MTTQASESTRPPLDGTLVLDFSHAAAGPFATMLLADFGARVVKVEKPGRGDGARHMSMTARFRDPAVGGDYFLGLNRNKESLALDLSQPPGRAIAFELASKADVLVENFRPGVMDRLGLGPSDLTTVNPGLIYCDITAFGTSGPLAGEAGMDIVAQARAGTVAITGDPDGPPARPGVSLADLSCGLQATIGILVALLARRNGASGQQLSVSLLDATLMMMANYAVALLNTDAELARLGSGHPQLAPYQAYATADGWVFVGCGTNQLWRRLCALLGLDRSVAADERFASNGARRANLEALNTILDPRFRSEPTEHWLAALKDAGIPASPIVSAKDAYLGEMAHGSKMVTSVEHPVHGRLLIPGVSINLDGTPARVRSAPPVLGQHTERVLREVLGLDPGQVAELAKTGTVEQSEVA